MTYDASPPKHAYQNPGRGRWYKHPLTDEIWPSITNVLDTAISKPALVPWSSKITAERAWELLPQMVAASRKPDLRELLTKELKGHHKIVKDLAADLGSRIHAMVEADVLGKPRPDDPEVAPFVVQAFQFFHDFNVNLELDVEATEATVLNRTCGYAGTGDLWLWLTIAGHRRLLVVDYKTSSTRATDSVFPEMGLQVAALAHAEKLLLDDGTEEDPPGPIHGTAILNLRKDGYALLPMPFVGAVADAFEAFKGALVTAQYLHQCYGEKVAMVPKPIREEVG